MTDREQEAVGPDWDKIAQDAIERHREVHGATWVVGSAAAVAKAGAEWADAHRSPEPPADVREALAFRLFVEESGQGEDWLRGVWANHPPEHPVKGSYYRQADAILSRFRVVPLGAEPDEEWEYAQVRYKVDGWERVLPGYDLDDRTYLKPCAPDAKGDILRRRPAGPWEPVTPRGEEQ